ncbi:MAG: polymer-forming cytoskeletal protein [Leptonema sp. (in: Bacteria)]|nr:polymer-forming cytoskeletal protein [Leptonema sp. (in: bacteria)]
MAKKPVVPIVTEEGAVATIFEKGTHFQGILEFEKPLQINGEFEGEIRSTGVLVIGEGARVKASIRCNTVIVSGTVIGNIEALRRIEMLQTGKIIGNIRTARLQMAEGVVFDGNCEMIDSQEESSLKASR